MKYLLTFFFVFTLFFTTEAYANPSYDDPYYPQIYREVSSYNPNPEESDWITRAILYSCARWQVDPRLVTAVFKQESGFSLTAVSPVGAYGIAQLMPDTAAGLGVNIYDPLDNIDGGVHYLRIQMDKFAGFGPWATTYAVAAYNAGPQAIIDYGGVPPYRETINYVACVSRFYNALLA